MAVGNLLVIQVPVCQDVLIDWVVMVGTDSNRQPLLALAGIYRSTVTSPLMVPAELSTLAVPSISDFKIKLPALFKVAPEATVTVPGAIPAVISNGVPKVATTLVFNVRSFNTRPPKAN